ncbi:Serine/threonine-protein kinase [Rhynchospora pubera]|uniref:Serine/threonine-protein kinase n=1 Tax=Rhynchospora pubera TaxID=906938 RepID=A0AAV8CA99_9POAL|nr:Serine/threonine-protein kinase [Rhynchospora pubera]
MKRFQGTVSAFTYQDLAYITKNFSETLGKGGFGSVYKGTLPNSTVVAVKRLRDINQSDKSFRAEVSTIGNIQHLNLIRLLGFCSKKGQKLLVYEYMPVGSLDKHLFGNSSASLTWKTRYQITLGISRGLHYLHEECRDCIIHCDIKPENILLDKSFVPKIADFGLAKLLGREFSRVLTSMRGTIGYLAPEWIAGSAITTKADVYSYGMMLFEIISGKRNRKERDELEDGSQEEEGNLSFFPAFAAKKLVGGDIHCLVDLITDADCNLEELERALKVALWCVQIEEDMRPSMRQVVQILEGQLNVNMPPIPRPFQVLTEIPDSINFFSIKPSKTGPAVKVPTS